MPTLQRARANPIVDDVVYDQVVLKLMDDIQHPDVTIGRLSPMYIVVTEGLYRQDSLLGSFGKALGNTRPFRQNRPPLDKQEQDELKDVQEVAAPVDPTLGVRESRAMAGRYDAWSRSYDPKAGVRATS
jgi:hypothetical protein